MEKLECLFCRKKFDINVFSPFCPSCQEPLLVSYDAKKRTFSPENRLALEKFLDFLPLASINKNLSLGEGNTPLVELTRLKEKLGLSPVFAKMEMVNPTHSFKDRGTSVAVQKAVAMGFKRIGTVSTGNMAISTAAYGARAGLQTFVLLKEKTPRENLLAAAVHNPIIVEVKGDYGELFYQSLRSGKKFNIYFMNSVDPFRIEGYKVTGFEIFTQLGMVAPQTILVPVSAAGHLIGLIRAFLDLRKEGFIQEIPVFVGVQPNGCSPLALAFSSGKKRFEKFSKVQTICHSISNPNPPGGNIVLKLIRENKGIILAVSDEEILEAQKLLAEYEGIFCQPESAVTLAALIKLKKNDELRNKGKAVLVLTGSGLKRLEIFDYEKMVIQESSLSQLEERIASLIEKGSCLD